MLILHSYDKYVIAFSGGKDSLAALLFLLDKGVDRSKIEIHHHSIDGHEGSNLMDWACTPAYVKAFAKSLDIPLYFSWREGGMEREMLRENSLTGGVFFQTPDRGLVYSPALDREKYYNTRLKFPQVSADLSVRWCSPYAKIMVMEKLLRNDARFAGLRTLVITGERGEESAARLRYKEFEPHKADLRNSKTAPRHIDHLRPLIQWSEEQVWEIIKKYSINPHPAYHLGWGRVSCQFCIFSGPHQLASARKVSPDRFKKIVAYENQFGVTIKRKETIEACADRGTPYADMDEKYLQLARSSDYNEPILLPAGEWKLPRGAFSKETCGPT